MATELGSLFYSLNIRDNTEEQIKAINKRLQDVGSDIQIDPSKFKDAVNAALQSPFSVTLAPAENLRENIQTYLKDKAVEAEIKPLTANLVSNINEALKSGSPINIENLSINPQALNTAIANSLQASGFSSVGEQMASEFAKQVKLKFEGETFTATVTANLDTINSKFQKLFETIERKEIKFKGDFSQIDDKLKEVLKTNIKLGIDPQTGTFISDIEGKLQGKVVKVAIEPLVKELKEGMKKALANMSDPPRVEVGIHENKLQRLVSNVLTRQGYMLTISTLTGLRTAIKNALVGNDQIRLSVDPNALVQSMRAALGNMQTKTFGLEVSKDVLHNSITQALQGHKFPIEIQVMKNQAQQAVQNALNGAANITNADALKYQRLMTGQMRAEQTELIKLKQAQLQAKDAASAHASASINLGNAWGSNIRIAGELGAAMASLYSLHGLKEFMAQVVEIGGELEHQKIALDTIYGDPGKTAVLFDQIKGLARQSPFGVMDLTKNIKQLSAYGVAYNEVYDTAKRLADISAATSVDINRLILAFGKTKNRTFLDGLEAKQFAYANIPIYEALSKKLTELEGKFVSIKDVMGRIKKREIGFDMVREILWDMTDEGGKFYNMQEKLAGSVKTSWKLVKDNIELMFGEIAESGAGSALKSLAEILQEATRHWKELAFVLAGGLTVWGTTRLATLGLSKAVDSQTKSIYTNLVASKQKEIEEVRALAITGQLTQRQRELLATEGRLTAVEIERAMVNQQLDKEELKRLYYSGMITKATMQRLVALKVLTRAEYEAIVGTNALNASFKKLKVSASGLWQSLKTGASSAFSSIFNWTTAIMATIGGLIYLWQKNQAEYALGEEVNNKMRERGEGMAKSLAEGLNKPFKDLTGPAAETLIEEYKNLMKDYATLPEDAIQRAIYDKDGVIRDTADQIQHLREELEGLKKVGEEMAKDNALIGTSISATGDGVFKEDVITNIKDYAEAYNKASGTYQKYVSEHKKEARQMVEIAKKTDPLYAKAIENAKNLSEEFLILAHNRGEYINAWKEIYDQMGKMVTRGGSLLGSMKVWNPTVNLRQNQEAISRQQMNEDIRAYAQYVKDQMEGLDMSEFVNQERVRQYFNVLIQEAGVTGKEMIKAIADEFTNADVDFYKNVQLLPDETQEKWVNEIEKAMARCTDEATLKALKQAKTVGFQNIPETSQQLVIKFFEEADEDIQERLPDLYSNTNSWFLSHPLEWVINFVFGKGSSEMSTAMKDIIDQAGGVQNLSESTLDIIKEIDGESKSIYDLRNTMQQLKQDAKNQMDAVLKQGVGKDSDSYKSAKKRYDEVEKAAKELHMAGLLTKDQKSNRELQKDTVAEKFKQQFKDLKDAWSEYQKWKKSVGDEAAAETVADSGLFGDMDLEKIPRNVEAYQKAIEEIESELKKAGVENHPQRESLLNEVLKTLLDVKKTIVDEDIRKGFETVETEFDRIFEQYDLYEKIRKATGNNDLAYTFSFGLDTDVSTDYITLVKQKVNAMYDSMRGVMKDEAKTLDFETTNIDNVGLLPEELQKAWREAVKLIQKYQNEQKQFVADLLSEYQNTREQIERINAERNEKITKLWNDSSLNDVQKTNLEIKIDVKADYEIFQLSNEYLQFFGGILAMTREEAEKTGSAIRQHLDEQLQAGTISAKEYYDEIEKIEGQLDKIRNIRNNAYTFFTGGFEGLNNKKAEETDAKRLALIQQIKTVEEEIAHYREVIANPKSTDEERKNAYIQLSSAESAKRMAEAQLKVQEKISKEIVKNQETWEKVAGVVGMISNIVDGIGESFDTIKDMADSLGVDIENNDWLNMGAVIDTFQAISNGLSKTIQGLMSGDIGGALSGVTSMLLTPITIWSRLHDKKLENDIKASQKLFDRYQSIIDRIEGKFSYFLGNRRNLEIDISADKEKIEWLTYLLEGGYTSYGLKLYGERDRKELEKYKARAKAHEEGGALGYERQLMIEQLEELERQKADYQQMKGNYSEEIEDVTQQIEEQKQAIRDYAEEMAELTYGINLSDWATQIGDALVNAFAKGEDAAEAFKDTVGNIMRSLVSNIITNDLIAPAMQDLQEWLFGEDGKGGVYGKDFLLNEGNTAELGNKLLGLQWVVEDAKDLYDAINDAMDGLMNDTERSDNSVRAGIQSITEDTADILASYVNAIRAYVAENNVMMAELYKESIPKLSIIAEAQLNQLMMIAENTRRNMEAAESIRESNLRIYDVLRRATQSKDNGIWIK